MKLGPLLNLSQPVDPDPDAAQSYALAMTADDASKVDDAAINRQEQIWAGMYGPSAAATYVAAARAMRAEQPETDIKDILRAVEPENEMDADEVGTYRPAVG